MDLKLETISSRRKEIVNVMHLKKKTKSKIMESDITFVRLNHYGSKKKKNIKKNSAKYNQILRGSRKIYVHIVYIS